MPVTAEWLPYESSDERYLIAKAVAEKRRFVKGLRVNLDADTPIASLVLKDTGEDACAIHIHDGDTECQRTARGAARLRGRNAHGVEGRRAAATALSPAPNRRHPSGPRRRVSGHAPRRQSPFGKGFVGSRSIRRTAPGSERSAARRVSTEAASSVISMRLSPISVQTLCSGRAAVWAA
jgi:hypothetical protein